MSKDVTLDCGDPGDQLSARSIRVIDADSDGTGTEVVLVAATSFGQTSRFVTVEVADNRRCRAEVTDTHDDGSTTQTNFTFASNQQQGPPIQSARMRVMSIADNSSSSSSSSSSVSSSSSSSSSSVSSSSSSSSSS